MMRLYSVWSDFFVDSEKLGLHAAGNRAYEEPSCRLVPCLNSDRFTRRCSVRCFERPFIIEESMSNELKMSIEENLIAMRKEYDKAKSSLRRYSPAEAEERVRNCFKYFGDELKEEPVIFPVKGTIRHHEHWVQDFNQTYDILDIYKVFWFFKCQKDSKTPGKKELVMPTAGEHRYDVRVEYEAAIKKLHHYSWQEAEHRVRDCFAITHLTVDNVFKSMAREIPKSQKTFDIFEIRDIVDHYDGKKLYKRTGHESAAAIEEEYAEAIEKVEIEHGSGFIIHDHFIITNKHVIEDALSDECYEICISNTVVGELPCEVKHCDAVKDLALLYCQGLNLKQNRIFPLPISNQSLLAGIQIFAFGFPMSHTGERALFVTGHVSGSKTTYSGHTLAVLNCSLNSGNSGGPILCWDKGQLKVVGVATQKHFKEILTLEERETIEKIRESLQTKSISSVSDGAIAKAFTHQERVLSSHLSQSTQSDPRQIPIFILTLKLYDALEMHSQFNLSNVLPGCYVIEFIKECISKHIGEGKEELTEVVKWSDDHI